MPVEANAETQEVAEVSTEQALMKRYCVACHNDRLVTGGVSFEGVDLTNVAAHADVLEKAVKKLRAGAMPPSRRPRPDPRRL